MIDDAPLSEDRIAVLADASYVEFARETARWSGATGEVVERDGIVLFAAASDFPVSMNGVIRVDRTVPAATVLDRSEAWFGEKGRGYSLSTNGFGAGEADLVAEAEARGLLHLMDTPAMACDARLADGSVPDGVELRLASSPDDIAAFVAINDAAYQTSACRAGSSPRRSSHRSGCWCRTCARSSPGRATSRSPPPRWC